MNPIFGYQASNELNNDSWKQLVIASSEVNDDVLKDTFTEWEKEFKDETKQPIPGAWRSAKSVIKNARAKGIPLTVPGGDVRGKTAVEKELKAHAALGTSPVISVEDVIAEFFHKKLPAGYRMEVIDDAGVTVFIGNK